MKDYTATAEKMGRVDIKIEATIVADLIRAYNLVSVAIEKKPAGDFEPLTALEQGMEALAEEFGNALIRKEQKNQARRRRSGQKAEVTEVEPSSQIVAEVAEEEEDEGDEEEVAEEMPNLLPLADKRHKANQEREELEALTKDAIIDILETLPLPQEARKARSTYLGLKKDVLIGLVQSFR